MTTISRAPRPRRRAVGRALTLLAAPVLAAALLLTANPVAVGVGGTATAGTAAGVTATGVTAAKADREVTKFPYGNAVRRSTNINTKYAQFPVGFRRVVRAELDRQWREADADPACANSPVFKLKVYHRAGFAMASQYDMPAVGEPIRCSQGGFASLWSGRGGTWRPIFKSQEAPSCRAFAYHRVPRGGHFGGCYTEDGEYDRW